METPPLFRWPGAKRHLVSKVLPLGERHLRATKGRVVSLFYGTGALERTIGAYDAPQIVAEAVPDLRALYGVLALPDGQAQLTAAIAQLLEARARKLKAGVSPEDFYRHIRDNVNLPPESLALVAARFLFLVGTCYNGLWRVNQSGRMNTPPDSARVAAWEAPSKQVLQIAAMNARRLTVVSDWTEAVCLVRPGDLIIADPPYRSGEVESFTSYTAAGFDDTQQVRLASFLGDFATHGCGVIAFNSVAARSLYNAGFAIEEVQRSGRISSKGDGRGAVPELLITGNLKGQ